MYDLNTLPLRDTSVMIVINVLCMYIKKPEYKLPNSRQLEVCENPRMSGRVPEGFGIPESVGDSYY